MMRAATIAKVEYLATMITDGTLIDHYEYEDKFTNKHSGKVPAWSTLKNNGFLILDGTKLKLVKGELGGLEVKNVNVYKFTKK